MEIDLRNERRKPIAQSLPVMAKIAAKQVALAIGSQRAEETFAKRLGGIWRHVATGFAPPFHHFSPSQPVARYPSFVDKTTVRIAEDHDVIVDGVLETDFGLRPGRGEDQILRRSGDAAGDRCEPVDWMARFLIRRSKSIAVAKEDFVELCNQQGLVRTPPSEGMECGFQKAAKAIDGTTQCADPFEQIFDGPVARIERHMLGDFIGQRLSVEEREIHRARERKKASDKCRSVTFPGEVVAEAARDIPASDFRDRGCYLLKNAQPEIFQTEGVHLTPEIPGDLC